MKHTHTLAALSLALLLCSACGQPGAAPTPSTPPTATPTVSLPTGEPTPTPEEVEGAFILYEGSYFDDCVYAYYSAPSSEEEDELIYCAFLISNVTATSFDFSVSEVALSTDTHTPLLPTQTAHFVGDGTHAVCEGEGGTLTFSFVDAHGAHPHVLDLQVTGLPVFEGHNYVNNAVPGHEFG